MEFKKPQLRAEVEHLKPRVLHALLDLEAFCLAEGMPTPLVTEVNRTEGQQLGIYGDLRFTYHFVWCAWDVRLRPRYTGSEQERLLAWLHETFRKPDFDVLAHEVGNHGFHLHFELNDHAVREEWERNHQPPGGTS